VYWKKEEGTELVRFLFQLKNRKKKKKKTPPLVGGGWAYQKSQILVTQIPVRKNGGKLEQEGGLFQLGIRPS